MYFHILGTVQIREQRTILVINDISYTYYSSHNYPNSLLHMHWLSAVYAS